LPLPPAKAVFSGLKREAPQKKLFRNIEKGLDGEMNAGLKINALEALLEVSKNGRKV